MKLKSSAVIGAVFVVGAMASADTVAPRPVPKIDQKVVAQQKLDDTNKLVAFVHTANADNIEGGTTYTVHPRTTPQIRDARFVVTRVAGSTFAPFQLAITPTGRPTWAIRHTAPAGVPFTTISKGDSFNLIGNLDYVTQSNVHPIIVNGPNERVPNVRATARHQSLIHNITVDGKPNALVFATPLANGPGESFVKPYGVTFDTSTRMWALATEDNASWDTSKAYLFNLALIEKPTISGPVRAFRFTVDSKNPDGPTRLSKLMAGKDDVVVIQHVIDAKGVYVNEPLAVGLEPDTGLWTITTPSRKVPDGAVFNVLVVKKTK